MKNLINNKKGLVSVIMPVYNGYPLISASIKSLQNQTYPNWECIIINDGSTDHTTRFLDSLNDERFIIFHFDENKGRPYARQKALELAKGEYIAMLDADDLYHPEKLSIQVKIMEDNPDIYLVSAGLCSFGITTDFIRIRGKGDGKKRHYQEDSFFAAHGPSMLRQEHAIKFSYNMYLQLGQDIDFLRRYLKGKNYIVLSDVLYYYSEFDSVNMKKISKTYKIIIKNSFREKKYIYGLKCLMKLMFLQFIFPFLGIKQILKSRGQKPNFKETSDFESYCLPLILDIIKSLQCDRSHYQKK